LLGRFVGQPWDVGFPALAVAGLAATGMFNRHGRDGLSLAASGVYPNVSPAVDPAMSLTTVNPAAPPYGLAVGLIWWSIGMALAIIYFGVIYW
jgi:cytochrome d ubiquinol oxidase subunit II